MYKGQGLEHVRNRLIRSENVFGIRSECVRNALGMRSERVRNTFGIRSERVRNTFGIRSERVRNTFGTRSEHVRNYSGPRSDPAPTPLRPLPYTLGTPSEESRTTSTQLNVIAT